MYSQLAGAKMLIINDAYYEDTKEQIVNDDGNGIFLHLCLFNPTNSKNK